MDNIKKAYLAGGCFWGLEELIRNQPGILDTEVGYMGGENTDPRYRNHPGHAQAVEVTYDPHITSFKKLLEYFFRIHNPTTLNQQGNDKGDSYRSAIFYQNDHELSVSKEVVAMVDESSKWGDPVITTFEKFDAFHPAEGYHQD